MTVSPRGPATNSPTASPAAKPGELWTHDQAVQLQKAIDEIFEKSKDSLGGLQFSVTIADPTAKDCPLVGCSIGFTDLVGYKMDEIVGRNCRFLIDPVPKDLVDTKIRQVSRDFCEAVRDGKEYRIPPELMQEYMPTHDRHSDDGVFCLQMNARKDGRLFRNMFYLRPVSLNEKPFIIGLQTEVGDDVEYAKVHEACKLLDENLSKVEGLLAAKFWFMGPMRRQDERGNEDGFLPGTVQPGKLKKPWSAENAQALQDAVDKIFHKAGGDNLAWLKMSLTIADPLIEGCPLVGCSTGFGTLTGYGMDDIVGRNCRFLVDPVPPKLVNKGTRKLARDFCDAVRDGLDFPFPEEQLQAWMPLRSADDAGIFCAQMNARKDGSLFENMFYMVRIELDEHPYIIGLQTSLPEGTLSTDTEAGATAREDVALSSCYKACRVLDENMGEVERCLAPYFWLTVPMRRQEMRDDAGIELAPEPDGAVPAAKGKPNGNGADDGKGNEETSAPEARKCTGCVIA